MRFLRALLCWFGFHQWSERDLLPDFEWYTPQKPIVLKCDGCGIERPGVGRA
jgi:hypothetical protein